MDAAAIIRKLEAGANPANVAGMARFGITGARALGWSAPQLRAMAREIGKDHELALELWDTGIYEARALAALIEDPRLVTKTQMERWARDFRNWADCDGTCLHLFVWTPFAREKAIRWSAKNDEFVKRAGFTLMACLAVHDKT